MQGACLVLSATAQYCLQLPERAQGRLGIARQEGGCSSAIGPQALHLRAALQIEHLLRPSKFPILSRARNPP